MKKKKIGWNFEFKATFCLIAGLEFLVPCSRWLKFIVGWMRWIVQNRSRHAALMNVGAMPSWVHLFEYTTILMSADISREWDRGMGRRRRRKKKSKFFQYLPLGWYKCQTCLLTVVKSPDFTAQRFLSCIQNSSSCCWNEMYPAARGKELIIYNHIPEKSWDNDPHGWTTREIYGWHHDTPNSFPDVGWSCEMLNSKVQKIHLSVVIYVGNQNITSHLPLTSCDFGLEMFSFKK